MDNQPTPLIKNPKKYIVGIILVALAIVASIIIYRILTTSTIHITTEEGAVISIATDKGGELVEIGQTQATYKTRQKHTVHFQSQKDDKITRATVLPKEYDDQTINLSLEPKITPERVVEGPLTNVLVEADATYGINKTTSSLTMTDFSADARPKLGFISLPYIDDIAWNDSDNFAYRSFDGEVGLFLDGKNLGTSIAQASGSGGSVSLGLYDLTRFPGKPLVLLGRDGIYTSKDVGEKIEYMSEVVRDELHYLGSDSSYIYYAGFDLPGHYATENDASASLDPEVPKGSRILVLDYFGNKVFDASLNDTGTIVGMTLLAGSDNPVLLTERGLIFINAKSGSFEIEFIYSQYATGLIADGSSLIVFANDGIWRFNPVASLYHLLASYPNGHSYIVDSVEYRLEDSGVKLRYTTKPSLNSNETISAGVYEIEL